MPPFPGIPYGPAPAWCFLAFEAGMYLFFVLCLLHAVKRGRAAVAYLLGGLAFGLVLEYLEVLSHSYTYGRFAIMFGYAPVSIPLCIGCGWAIIMYTARLFSDALRLPLLPSAALDTLLALNIDLSMDIVAYRLHMWHWYWTGTHLNPLTAEWFGIPYGNFIGWITVVFCYSAFSRKFERIVTPRGTPSVLRVTLVAVLALIASQTVLIATETDTYRIIVRHLGLTSGHRLIFFSVVLIALAIYGWRERIPPAAQMSSLARWVPSWLHIFCAVCFFSLGFFRENKAMTVIACVNILAGIVLHFYPWRRAAASMKHAASLPCLESEPSLESEPT